MSFLGWIDLFEKRLKFFSRVPRAGFPIAHSSVLCHLPTYTTYSRYSSSSPRHYLPSRSGPFSFSQHYRLLSFPLSFFSLLPFSVTVHTSLSHSIRPDIEVHLARGSPSYHRSQEEGTGKKKKKLIAPCFALPSAATLDTPTFWIGSLGIFGAPFSDPVLLATLPIRLYRPRRRPVRRLVSSYLPTFHIRLLRIFDFVFSFRSPLPVTNITLTSPVANITITFQYRDTTR